MRITGGSARGLRLSTLKGREIRPTSDRVRESLFQILTVKLHHDWSGIRVLDLFSGSGSLGIEAISRGAESAVFADISARALECIRKNLERPGFGSRATLLRFDVRKQRTALRKLQTYSPFQVVFADPPYSRGFPVHVLRLASSFPLLREDGCLVIEEFSRTEMPREETGTVCSLLLEDSRVYGQTSIFFYRACGFHDGGARHE